MEQIKIPEIGKTFFIKDSEYKVNFVRSDRFSADPHTSDKKYLPEINEKFMIDGVTYIIIYVHTTKRRITAVPLSNGY